MAAGGMSGMGGAQTAAPSGAQAGAPGAQSNAIGAQTMEMPSYMRQPMMGMMGGFGGYGGYGSPFMGGYGSPFMGGFGNPRFGGMGFNPYGGYGSSLQQQPMQNAFMRAQPQMAPGGQSASQSSPPPQMASLGSLGMMGGFGMKQGGIAGLLD